MRTKRSYILILGFAAVLAMPLFFACANRLLGRSDELHGVGYSAQTKEISAEGILDGSVQSSWDDWISEHIPARATLLKLRNQGIFSVFNESPNAGVLLCPDGQLIEREYVYKYEKIYPPAAEEYVRDECDKIAVIRDRLRAEGKELYIFITPTKPRYYEGSIPEQIRKMQAFPDRPGNYEVLTRVLGDYDFEVFDSVDHIRSLTEGGDEVMQFPMYQQTGTHWTWTLGLKTALAFADFMDERSAWSFPQGQMIIGSTDTPVFPDADLYDILNIYTRPWGNYFNADIVINEKEAKDAAEYQAGVDSRPDMLVRGGSFLGQTISPLINHGYFRRSMYLENTKVYSDDWPDGGTFSDYEELEPALSEQLKETDILILEINEAHVPTMSFGFIDYLFDHPGVFD